MLGGIFGAVGSVAGAAIQASAQKEAMKMQLDALKKQREWVYKELDPGKISGMATAQDILRSKNRLALQGVIDPKLLEARYKGQAMLFDQLGKVEEGGGDAVAKLTEQAAAATSPQIMALKEKLLNEAANYIEAGATLPPDVQAEIVKAGLEKSGMVSGAASVKGLGGNIVRSMVGEKALALKNDRIARASTLTKVGQDLENSRTSLLASIFPALKALQTQNMQNTAQVLNVSNQMVPEAGLGGTDIANLWLSRVGATGQLAQSAADIAARGATNMGNIWGNAIGGATASLGKAAPSIYDALFAKTPQQAPVASYYNPPTGSNADYAMSGADIWL